MALVEVKLFDKWSFSDVTLRDIYLQDYLAVKQKMCYVTYLPHTARRYNLKRFRKAHCPIVERLTNSLMVHGRNNGKKVMAVRIVKHAFEIIHLLTDKNPIQILVDAIINAGPREDATRIGSAGTVRRQAVDVSPLRRVNQSIYFLTTGVSDFFFVPFVCFCSVASFSSQSGREQMFQSCGVLLMLPILIERVFGHFNRLVLPPFAV